VIAPVTDFFIISVVYMNDCTDDLISTGIAPMTSKSTNYTLVLKHYYIQSAKLDYIIITFIFLGKIKMCIIGGIFSKR